ncbi:MAG: hypothetical protein K2M60_09975 [Lachnospiraceae bacterium]|nr:hypothetical protein [Lachnospiraceae bacterium]MDE6253147.1 hypothetical protein [Lachnospiraceae bacterium]
MKMSKTFKKFAAMVMAFAMLLGIPGAGITAKADNSPVNMYYIDIISERYGSTTYTVYIQIDANSAYRKDVFVHYNAGNGIWENQQAGFVTKTDYDTKEIWAATVTTSDPNAEYTIKYVGDGKVYWDNNNGKNYNKTDILGVANIAVIRPYRQDPANYKITAAVKNIGFAKEVKVKYTTDNWANSKWADLSYEGPSDGKNYEYWSVTLNLNESDMSGFQFCVSYTVNGQTYWDSNFGRNFNSTFYRPI